MTRFYKAGILPLFLLMAVRTASPAIAGPASSASGTDPRQTPIGETLLRQQIATTPLSSETHQILIARAFTSKKTEAAYASYTRLANANPGSFWENLWAGTVSASHYAALMGKMPDASQTITVRQNAGKYLRRAVQLNPKSGLAHAEYGYWCLMGEGNAAEGMSSLTQSIKLAPGSPRVWCVYALALVNPSTRSYNLKAAEAAYRKAIALDGRYSTPYYGLAHLYYDQKQYAQARQAITTYEKLLPTAIRLRPDAFRDAVKSAR